MASALRGDAVGEEAVEGDEWALPASCVVAPRGIQSQLDGVSLRCEAVPSDWLKFATRWRQSLALRGADQRLVQLVFGMGGTRAPFLAYGGTAWPWNK